MPTPPLPPQHRPAATATLVLVFAAPALLAQSGGGATQQKVTGPQARYWLSAETASGLGLGMGAGGAPGAGGMPGLGNMAEMMNAMRNPDAARKSLRLDLGATRSGAPSSATHQIPPALALGASLPLIGPEPSAPPPREVDSERDVPEMQRGEVRGRMLFFWGCGESVGPGQPVVLDLATLAEGQLPPDMRGGVFVRPPRSGPGSTRDRGYVFRPNRQSQPTVPANASLVGDHVVQGNLNPEIRFTVGATHDFMAPLRLQRAPVTAGTQKLNWNTAPTALGYFLAGMGGKEMGGGGDIVFWISSAVRLLGCEGLMGFLAPAETERLVREKAVLPATSTECQVPREVIAAAGGELMMVNLNAFGPELNVVHPPRPQDPRVDWNQEYAVKLRLRSSTASIAGMGERRGRRGQEQAAQEPPPPEAPAAPAAPKAVDAVKDALKGLFGR